MDKSGPGWRVGRGAGVESSQSILRKVVIFAPKNEVVSLMYSRLESIQSIHLAKYSSLAICPVFAPIPRYSLGIREYIRLRIDTMRVRHYRPR